MASDVKILIAGGSCTIEHVDSFMDAVHHFAEKNQMIIQLFDAEKIYGKPHLLSAVHHALRSEKEKRMTTNSIEMELLLYASGERQLKLAIPKMGVKNGCNDVAVVFLIRSDVLADEMVLVHTFFSSLDIDRDDDVLEGNENTLRLFGISDGEKQTVSKQYYASLILERIALIDIIK
ncbi:MAG: KEOPS complex subunit Cgi121 [Thermoplasmatota archaeon]